MKKKRNDSNLKKIRSKRKLQSTKQKFKKNIKYLLLVIFLIVIVSIVAIIKRPKERIANDNVEVITVMGLEDIPVYPNSVFLYGDNLDNEVVKDMLAKGQSAYLIQDNTDFDNVKEYYANQLTSLGWNLVLDVEIGSEDKRSGQYWINDERGLRIYSKYNDIWYEYITVEQAQNGLSDRVSNEIEIDMLLAGSEYQDLLPDYPWQIKIPKEYLIRYELSEFEDLRAVNFQRISTGLNITIYPIGYWGAKALDLQLDDYIKILNTGSEKWGVSNTKPTVFRGESSLTGGITSGSSTKDIMMIKNNRNFVTYILIIDDISDPLYQYIIENITYLGDDS